MSITKILFAVLFVLAVFFSIRSSNGSPVSDSGIYSLKSYTAVQDTTDDDKDDDDGGIGIPPDGDD